MTFDKRLMLPILLAVGITCWWAITSRGQEPSTDEAAQLQRLDAQLKDFFNELSQSQVDEAYRRLLNGTRIAQQQQAVAQLQEKTRRLPELYGPMQSVEQFDTTRLGRSVVMLKYLYNCERYPVVWYFTYYRSSGSSPWKLIAVRFDTDLTAAAQ
jgi:hypothetical protein